MRMFMDSTPPTYISRYFLVSGKIQFICFGLWVRKILQKGKPKGNFFSARKGRLCEETTLKGKSLPERNFDSLCVLEEWGLPETQYDSLIEFPFVKIVDFWLVLVLLLVTCFSKGSLNRECLPCEKWANWTLFTVPMFPLYNLATFTIFLGCQKPKS